VEALGACLLIYALITQYGGMLKRHDAPLVLSTVLLEGLFVFGGLAYLASSLTDRFSINYAYAGLMVAGFGVGGLLYSFSVKRLVGRIGELGTPRLPLRGVGVRLHPLMRSWQWFIPLVILLGIGATMRPLRPAQPNWRRARAAVSLFAFFFFMGQATGPQVLGSILKSRATDRHSSGGRGAVHRGRDLEVNVRAFRRIADGQLGWT
jgi:hypothetical protein